jgi:hypothetical protein
MFYSISQKYSETREELWIVRMSMQFWNRLCVYAEVKNNIIFVYSGEIFILYLLILPSNLWMANHGGYAV